MPFHKPKVQEDWGVPQIAPAPTTLSALEQQYMMLAAGLNQPSTLAPATTISTPESPYLPPVPAPAPAPAPLPSPESAYLPPAPSAPLPPPTIPLPSSEAALMSPAPAPAPAPTGGIIEKLASALGGGAVTPTSTISDAEAPFLKPTVGTGATTPPPSDLESPFFKTPGGTTTPPPDTPPVVTTPPPGGTPPPAALPALTAGLNYAAQRQAILGQHVASMKQIPKVNVKLKKKKKATTTTTGVTPGVISDLEAPFTA